MAFALHISGKIHHMIVVCCTQVQNDDISECLFNFFKIMIFRVVSRVKEQKTAQIDKKFCLSRSISQEPNMI